MLAVKWAKDSHSSLENCQRLLVSWITLRNQPSLQVPCLKLDSKEGSRAAWTEVKGDWESGESTFLRIKDPVTQSY